MSFNIYLLFYLLLTIFCTIPPIWAAFEDFVIRNQKDLQRFGTSKAEASYAAADELINDDDDELYNDELSSTTAIGYKCDDYGDLSCNYDMCDKIGDNDVAIMDLPGYDVNIDETILKEVIWQLQKLLCAGDNVGRCREDLAEQVYVKYFENKAD